MVKTVVVGMSGGVDSSVAALLLKQQGYRVIGLFMKNWDETDASGQCQAAADYEDVAATCAKIDIPFMGVNFVKEYREQVFAEFLADYKAGFTPNPDILCNREIKFKVFFAKAMSLGADYLATGHYCRVSDGQLLKGVDTNKDQTYFLAAIDGKVLDKVLFPIGELEKTEVRRIAREHGLPTHGKKDSTGICFIGERKFREFLSGYLVAQPGEFRRLNEEVVGQHLGSVYYTIGQRKRLGLGGEGLPWFVIRKDNERNIVYVERGDHPAMYADSLVAESVNWLGGSEPSLPFTCRAKIRYRQEDQECTIERFAEGQLKVCFRVPQRGVAVRQQVVFYSGNHCLGGAFIKSSDNNSNLSPLGQADL